MPTLGRPKMPTQKMSTMSDGERLRNAKEIVEKAVKVSRNKLRMCDIKVAMSPQF